MQNAETVLGVLRERGIKGLPCDELYRQLFNKELYLVAYGNIYANQGAMTPGATQETVDGMSVEKIERIIDAMRHERYRFSPVRRTYIPKKNGTGKRRPLGLPTWSDKLVGEVVRLLLEAYYDPTFSDHSHGFRAGRGCHTALREVEACWKGTVWLVEGDIADCFGSLDHEIMMAILAEKIRDNRFLRLIRNMLKAGYLEDWSWNATLSGAPQGGVVSPVLSSIYLHKLDEFVETVLIPEYTRGTRRKAYMPYRRVQKAMILARNEGDREKLRSLRKEIRHLPSADPRDPGYRRLKYVRYADDHLLGFTGPRAEAEKIKQRLTEFLRDELKLELSQEKTLITHARTKAARFLGYEIITLHANNKMTGGHRKTNGKIALRLPRDVVRAYVSPYYRRGKPASQANLVNCDDSVIIATYGQKYRGVVQYYLLANDVWRMERLRWVMEVSMLRTLAAKHQSTVGRMARRYKAKILTPHGLRTCFEARIERAGRKPLIARFGGIPLRRKKSAVIADRIPAPLRYQKKELVTRLQRGECEICAKSGKVEVHHVRKLADLGAPGSRQFTWAAVMMEKRRKTLVVCSACHNQIHSEPTPPLSRRKPSESYVLGN
ncbi:reverse transcriptase domain-containing protein [Streptomyces sp. NPDC048057]|uniref:reverse transcriptase domain-containing protein n=1 Tax=Streptomyces sp. NPDC048057 TaxID=3155628 RepID=UPI0033F9D4DE